MSKFVVLIFPILLMELIFCAPYYMRGQDIIGGELLCSFMPLRSLFPKTHSL